MALQAASNGIRRRARTCMGRLDPAHADVLELGELEDSVLAALASQAAFLHAAEGRDLGGNQTGVQADDAVLERFGDAPRARQVARVQVRGERSEERRVGK